MAAAQTAQQQGHLHAGSGVRHAVAVAGRSTAARTHAQCHFLVHNVQFPALILSMLTFLCYLTPCLIPWHARFPVDARCRNYCMQIWDSNNYANSKQRLARRPGILLSQTFDKTCRASKTYRASFWQEAAKAALFNHDHRRA